MAVKRKTINSGRTALVTLGSGAARYPPRVTWDLLQLTMHYLHTYIRDPKPPKLVAKEVRFNKLGQLPDHDGYSCMQ